MCLIDVLSWQRPQSGPFVLQEDHRCHRRSKQNDGPHDGR
jgi:hypothetical protein